MPTPLDSARALLQAEASALAELATRLDGSFTKAVDLIAAHQGKVVLCGVGKSGLIGQKIAATLCSTGTPAIFLHAADAVHGVSGVEEDGGRARAAKRRGDLLADEAGFADAAEHDLALVGGDQVDGLREGAVEARGEFGERGGFGLQEGTGGVEGSGHVKRRVSSLEYGVWERRARGPEGRRERQTSGGAKVQIGAELLCKS